MQIESKFKSSVVPPVLNPFGLSNREGTSTLYFSKKPGSHSFKKNGVPEPTGESAEVQITTLDHYFETQNIPESPIFMKIDVEGLEDYVIEGGLNTIQERKPDLFVEVRGRQNTFDAILEMLIPLGYQV